ELGVAPTDTAAALRFRMDLGFAIDGAALDKNAATLAGHAIQGNYDETRGYGFGDLYAGSRGLLLPSLSTYLAAHATFQGDLTGVQPLASVYDRGDALRIRAAWAEADDLFEQRWLAPIRVRAGRQWIYGVAPTHFDGAVLGWEQRVVAVHLYAGSRVPDFDDRSLARGAITGVDAHLDLQRWRGFPMVLDAAAFSYGDHDHARFATSVTRGRGFALRGAVRSLDGRLAHEQVTARFKISDVTLLSAALDHRSSYDWRWDPEYVSTTEPGAARRYLDLGAVGPRGVASVRAGTVLLGNIDLLVRGAGALDQKRHEVADSSYAATWGELGAALEVRARRTLAIGASTLVRKYLRDSLPEPGPMDAVAPAISSPLFASPLTGEMSFVEVGVSARYQGGARTLSASAELVARRVRWHKLYPVNPLTDFDGTEVRGGGQFVLAAWITPRVRLRFEYDLSTTLARVPEITGYKNLRIALEGTL
ncbi:MAG: hypothetical protein K8W52_23315, partial [Deltaproteobacteria bacterium]|nr:hypothetical protein [Deltaproteobacteria bacterium]